MADFSSQTTYLGKVRVFVSQIVRGGADVRMQREGADPRPRDDVTDPRSRSRIVDTRNGCAPIRMPMTAGEVVLAVIGACVLARMALSLYRIGRGVAAARSEVAVWRRQHPGRRHR